MRAPVLIALLATTAVVFSALPGEALSAAAPEPTEPAGIARAIYEAISAGDGDHGGQVFWLDPKTRPNLFSAELCTLWAKADAKAVREDDPAGAIDFDPITASQDPLVKSFTVKVEKQDARAATVAVTLVDPRGRRDVVADETVRLDFVRGKDRWAIDDVRGSVGGRAWSVAAILKSYVAR